MSAANDDRPSDPTLWLWLVVLVEILSPLPAFLSLGAIWVLIARPAWFPRLVERLYRAP